MKPHELAMLFPAMPQSGLEELAEDIKRRGQLQAVVTLEGKILDGIQREAACELVGITPRRLSFESLNGKIRKAGPLAFVMSANLHRRHLTTKERAEIGVKAHEMELATDRASNEALRQRAKRGTGKRSSRIAKSVGISRATLERAIAAKKSGRKRRKAEHYVPDPNAPWVPFREGWKPSDIFPGTDITYQEKFRRALLARASDAIAMRDEDWSMYKA